MKMLTTLSFLVASVGLWAQAYQVTGPVTAIKGDTITVQKGSEKWEIQKDPASKVTGDLKVGSKVTIEYTMTAKTVDVKTK